MYDLYQIRINSTHIKKHGMGMLLRQPGHTKAISLQYMAHRLNHINPIVGPYMSHIIWFCKGSSEFIHAMPIFV